MEGSVKRRSRSRPPKEGCLDNACVGRTTCMKAGTLLAILLVQGLFAAEEKTLPPIAAEIGGVKVELPAAEWKLVPEGSNSVGGVRARHTTLGIEMVTSRFVTDLSVAEYAAMMAGALLTTNIAAGFKKISKSVDLPRPDIETLIASAAGRKISKEIVKDGRKFEFRTVFFQRVRRGDKLERQFDIHSQAAEKKLFRRDFVLRCKGAGEIVQVTYTGPSEAVFTDRGIIRSVRPRKEPG